MSPSTVDAYAVRAEVQEAAVGTIVRAAHRAGVINSVGVPVRWRALALAEDRLAQLYSQPTDSTGEVVSFPTG
jgi:hypothetical protein